MMGSDSKNTTRPIESDENKYCKREIDISQLTLSEKKGLYEQLKKNLAEFDKPKTVKLPEDWVYDNIDEAVRNCRKIYFIFIALLSYSLLTILTTSDQDLFLGQNLKLPILGVTIPLNFFLLFVPPLAIGLYTYMQLYLLKVNKLIEFAITVCSQTNPGCEKDKKTKCDLHIICPKHQNRLYPWMHIFSRWSEGVLGWLQKVFGKFSIWWLLPITQLILSLFIVKKHDPKSFYFQLFFTLVGTCVVLAFWVHNKGWEMKIPKINSYLFKKLISSLRLFYRILFKRDRKENSKILGKTLRELSHFKEGFAILFTILIISGFLNVLSSMAQEGKLWWVKDAWSGEVGKATKIIRNLIFANLSQGKLITEPENDQKYDSFSWLNLEGFRLEGANLGATTLKKANLQKTQLKNANLNDADLDNTNLEQANLNFATLSGATLKGANLLDAQLEKTNLDFANLQKADLYNANLKEATLWGANLQKTNLHNANLRDANLVGANLGGALLEKANLFHADLRDIEGITRHQLEKAVNWQLAFYSREDLHKFGLPEDHNKRVKDNNFSGYDFEKANLKKADLKGFKLQHADLTEANLKYAVLRRANLHGTILERADLQGADLRDTKWDERDKKLSEQHERNQKIEGCEGKLFNAKNYLLALYSKDMLAILKLPSDHNERMKKNDLSGYELPEANLQEAVLREINLKRANLRNSDLKKAIFERADIQDADLTGANLQGADLRGAKGISKDQLLRAKNCKLALYSKEWLTIFDLPEDHNDRLRNKNFESYNLEGANLQEADLRKFNLRKANLQKANLAEVFLDEADLGEANLKGANLEKTDLGNANLRDADLQEVKLISAQLVSSDLEQADLTGAKLEKANLFRSNLNQANLKGANLDQTILKEANLQGADLRGAIGITKNQLEEAVNWQLAFYSEDLIKQFEIPEDHNKRVKDNNFSGYDFKKANLKKADLEGADLRKANLRCANLQEADLRGADLHEVQLNGADIKWADLSRSKGITPGELASAKNHKLAFYSKNMIDILDLPPDHNRRVKKKNLSGYDLQKADLQETDLRKASLKGADLREALLNGTRLGEANLQGADLRGAIGITKDQLEKAVNWQLAFYSREDLHKFGLPEDHNTRVEAKNYSGYDFRIANLKQADLEGADLPKANLRGANLQEADLRKVNLLDAVLWEANLQDAVLQGANIRGADLEGANLQGADLRDIIFFNHTQFSKVKTLYQCQLDDNLRLQLTNKYPLLFEEMIQE